MTEGEYFKALVGDKGLIQGKRICSRCINSINSVNYIKKDDIFYDNIFFYRLMRIFDLSQTKTEMTHA
jgi:hypothetical protein